MTTHTLKIWPQYYQAVADGRKTFEIRENDRGFQAGDTVILREFAPAGHCRDPKSEPLKYMTYEGMTGSPDLTFKIGYVLPIDAKRVVFSLVRIK